MQPFLLGHNLNYDVYHAKYKNQITLFKFFIFTLMLNCFVHTSTLTSCISQAQHVLMGNHSPLPILPIPLLLLTYIQILDLFTILPIYLFLEALPLLIWT